MCHQNRKCRLVNFNDLVNLQDLKPGRYKGCLNGMFGQRLAFCIGNGDTGFLRSFFLLNKDGDSEPGKETHGFTRNYFLGRSITRRCNEKCTPRGEQGGIAIT